MPYSNDGVMIQEYVYDFSEDGGATGELNLEQKAGVSAVPVGGIIRSVTAKVLTTCTGATATVAWGNEDDEDGYSGTAIAVASLTAGAVFNGWDNGAVLLWDDTNDHPIYVNVADAADAEFKMTIGTAALTAGKIVFLVEYLLPKASA